MEQTEEQTEAAGGVAKPRVVAGAKAQRALGDVRRVARTTRRRTVPRVTVAIVASYAPDAVGVGIRLGAARRSKRGETSGARPTRVPVVHGVDQRRARHEEFSAAYRASRAEVSPLRGVVGEVQIRIVREGQAGDGHLGKLGVARGGRRDGRSGVEGERQSLGFPAELHLRRAVAADGEDEGKGVREAEGFAGGHLHRAAVEHVHGDVGGGGDTGEFHAQYVRAVVARGRLGEGAMGRRRGVREGSGRDPRDEGAQPK